MRNTKRIIIKVIAFIIIFIILDNTLIPFIIKPYPYSKNALKDQKKQDYNTVFIGASKILFGIDPEIIEEKCPELGEIYNAGTPSQKINATYYYLKDLCESNDIQTVVLGMTYRAYHADYDLYDMSANMDVFDRLTNGSIKRQFMIDVLGVQDSLAVFLKSYRYGNKVNNGLQWMTHQVYYRLRNIKIIKNTMEGIYHQVTGNYWEENASYSNGLAYVADGYSIMDGMINNGNSGIPRVEEWDINNMSKEGIQYLQKIVDFCKENNIELIMIMPPFNNAYVYSVDRNIAPYDEINQFFEKYAKSQNVRYYNFDLAKAKKDSIQDDCFADARHLNRKGAEVFSKLVGEVLSQSIHEKEVADYFYNSFEEMREDIKYVVGVYLVMTDEQGIKSLIAGTLQNNDFLIEYEFIGITDNGENEILQSYSAKDNFPLTDIEKYYKYRVNARNINSNKEYEAYYEVNAR